MVRRVLVGLLGAAVMAAVIFFTQAAQQPKATAKRTPPPAPVLVAQVATRTVPVRLEAIGTVQARSTVAIKSRVDGQLVEAAVHEGQRVKKGDLLFRIDPRPYEAALRQAEANLARDQANLKKAESDLTRYQSLSEKGYSSQQKYEEAVALKSSLLATIRADEAAIEIARLQLEHTRIAAPIDGRTGSLLAYAGNLVKANADTAMIVITETQPVRVAFSVPEKYLTDIKQRMAAGPLTVFATIPEHSSGAIKGTLYFINNAVDTTTGTIQLKATFDNEDDLLTPGQFVEVTIDLNAIENALVVPSEAVQDGQKGTYVFVVKPDKTVELKQVAIGPSIEGVTVITDGLKRGDTVVTDGQLRLFPGAKVAPKGADGDGEPKGKGGRNNKGAQS